MFTAIAALLAGAGTFGFITWRKNHAHHAEALAIPDGRSIKAGLAWKQVTLRIPPSFSFIEPPDFVAEGDGLIEEAPADANAYAKKREEERKKNEEKLKKSEDERKRKEEQENEKRTHKVTMAIHVFEGGTGELPLGSKSPEAPPILHLLDRFSTAVQNEGWDGAKRFLTPDSRAAVEREIKDSEKSAEFRSRFSKARPLAALFAVEPNGRLFVSARLPDNRPIFGHIEFCVSKVGHEYLLGFSDELSEDEGVLLHDLGTAFLKNGKSIVSLEVK